VIPRPHESLAAYVKRPAGEAPEAASRENKR